ncbi:hypothetical protein HLI18_33830 [Rhizobium laguerreae]|uniref:hypothetical protein n=1 Tax=Rhizobium laguerreae TaxID=1076926 RepID=UPI001478FF01|nr:hypothetical protein [Rhizobium laguerreae]NNG74713.1 hypothetical protein [Rhizobium laguerreae]
MKPSVRAAIAAIASAHSGDNNVGSVYSHSESSRRTITVTVNGSSVTSYDHESGCHINGSLPSLYHYGVGAHITLNPRGDGSYDGYDYDTGSHFTVSVSGHMVQIYDHGESSNFAYSA